MIGTRVDKADAPRMVQGKYGWWFIGNQTWTLLRREHRCADGVVRQDIDDFLRKNGAYRPRIPKSFSLTVLTTTTCNLGCGYCFQNMSLDSAGGHRPPRIERQRLERGTIDRITRFTARRMAEADLEKLYLLLFGGEPLLNFRGCMQMLEAANKIGLQKATMTTNGVLLTPEVAKNLESAGLNHIQVTFDGSREDHDKIRVQHSGGPTFDAIVRNVESSTEVTDLIWNFRVNVSHLNFDRIGDLFSQLEGRVDPSRCSVTFAWVGDAGFGYSNALRHSDEVVDGLVAWSITALKAGFRLGWPSMKTTCQICSNPGGRYGAVVNADGTLYSCWQSAGKHGFEVGTIDDGYLETSQVSDRWVTCGYEYEQVDPLVADEFHDRVDSQVLDYLYETGQFGSSTS